MYNPIPGTFLSTLGLHLELLGWLNTESLV